MNKTKSKAELLFGNIFTRIHFTVHSVSSEKLDSFKILCYAYFRELCIHSSEVNTYSLMLKEDRAFYFIL